MLRPCLGAPDKNEDGPSIFYIDETVPDHSTLCKTRKRIPEAVFDEVFNRILLMCIESGLVKGKTQSLDSAYINANASLDHMAEIKLIDRDPKAFLDEVKKVEDENDEELKKRGNDRLKKHQKSMETFTEYRKEQHKR
ncbi:MAG: transposase [Bacteroidota bacterium]